MSLIRRAWDSQPRGRKLRLDLGDEIASGMIGAWVPTPAGYIDASPYKNHLLTRVGTTPGIIQPGPNKGLAGQFTTSDAFTGGTATPDLSNVQGGFSVAVWVKFAASPTSYGGVFARAGTIGATDAGGDWALLHRSTSKRLVLARSGQELFDMFSNVSDGVWYLCHMSVPVSGTAYWWVSGGTYGPATQFNAVTFNRIRTGAGAVGINGSVTGAGTGNSGIGRAYLWNRATTQREAAELYLREWARFAPRLVPMPVYASGGGSTNLTIQDATHGHTADGLTITVASTLAIADATHAHAADSLTLTTSTVLVIADATHGHMADSLTLSVSGATDLVIQDALHGHTADSLALTLGYADLAIADALHAHAADNLTLGGLYTDLELILKILSNRQELNAGTGTFTIYDDDSVSVLFTASAWADAAGTVPYSGGTLGRIDALA